MFWLRPFGGSTRTWDARALAVGLGTFYFGSSLKLKQRGALRTDEVRGASRAECDATNRLADLRQGRSDGFAISFAHSIAARIAMKIPCSVLVRVIRYLLESFKYESIAADPCAKRDVPGLRSVTIGAIILQRSPRLKLKTTCQAGSMRIMPKFTYANVVSTLALFMAVATGGAFAATTLAPNSVTSRHIKNGQVGVIDLSPAVRKLMNGGSASTPKPLGPGWHDAQMMYPNTPLFPCPGTANNCAADGLPGSTIGFTESGGPGPIEYGNTKTLEYRLSGTVTNNGEAAAKLYVYAHRPLTTDAPIGPTNERASCTVDVEPGQTATLTATACSSSGAFNVSQVVNTRLRVTTDAPNPKMIGSIKLEWRKVS